MEEQNYKHIKGWGIDANPDNEPTYPMKKYTGDDHNRLSWDRPPLQPDSVEVLQSIEHPRRPATFGTPLPPRGLSGKIRRFAFKYSEGSYFHWLPLILADRVDMVEGIIDDLKQGHVPNLIAERGLKTEWKYNKKGLIKKAVIYAGVACAVIALLSAKNKKHRKHS